MEETVYEWMERIGLVDWLLATLALLVPLLVATWWWIRRRRPWVSRHRPDLVMLVVCPPVLWVLWKVYNAVMNHYGLDSVFALFLNGVIFAATGAALAWIYRRT